MKRLAVLVIAAVTAACGSGNSSTSAPTSPAPTPPTSNSGIAVTSLAATTENTSTGVTYHVTFTVRATGQVGATITSLKVSFGIGLQGGSATFSNLADKLSAGGAVDERLNVNFTAAAPLYDKVAITVTYTDDQGVVSTFDSTNGSISPPSGPTTPNPPPPAGQTFDGTYDFSFMEPDPAGTPMGSCGHCINVPRSKYFKVTNGTISSTDGLLHGTVDTLGKATFTSLCPFGAKDPATWTGALSVSTSQTGNFGNGTYSCVDTPIFTWKVLNGK